MSGSMTALQQPSRTGYAAARLPEAIKIAREIMNNPDVSESVRAIAASVLRRHGFPLKLDS